MSQDPFQGELSSLRRRAARSVWDKLREEVRLRPPEPPPPKPLNGHALNGHAPRHPPPEIEVQFNLLPDATPASKPAKKRAPPRRPSPDGVAAITDAAIAAYNDILAMPNGVLSRVTHVGIENRRAEVARSIAMARRMCEQLYGDEAITPEFWQQYFGEVNKDNFKSGRMMGGDGHDKWRPNFEYLTRPKTMLAVFENAVSHAR